MNTGLIEKALLAILLVILGGIVLHAPLTVYFGSLLPDFELIIKAWKEILMIPAAVLTVLLVYRSKLWPELVRDKLLWLMAGYVVLHFITLLIFWQGWPATLAGLAIDLRFIAYFVLVYVLIKSRPDWRRWFMKVAVAGAVIVVGFGFLQLFLPHDVLKHIGYDKYETIAPYLTVDRNYDFIRINSTLRGPNPLGAYVVIVLAAVAAAMTAGRLRLGDRRVAAATILFTLASTAVLWVSYSRSALVAAVMAVALVGLIVYGRRVNRYVWVGIVALGLMTIGGLYVARDTNLVSHVILHEDPNEGNDVNSNDGHVESLVIGLERMAEQPLGAGVGSTGSASLLGDSPIIIENHYLFIAHEIGWLGLILFMAIFSLVLWRLWCVRRDWLATTLLASGVGLAAIGILLPVWVDDTVAIVWWGLAAMVLASNNRRDDERSTN